MAKINEVAEAAGVAISTVSYALSGKRPVSLATRRRIEKAVLELDYRPNAGARMLAGSRMHVFALSEPFRVDSHAPTHMAFVLATSIAARAHDYDILLLTDEQATAGMRRVATSGLADGMIVLDVAPRDPRVPLARGLSIPSVFVGIPDDPDGLICVDLDFEAATALAVRRLAEAGHGSIALIGQAETAYEMSNFPPRVRTAFFGATGAHGIAATFSTTGAERMSTTAARRALVEALDAGVTGLVLHCGDDAHAAILTELDTRGVHVPRDLSIVSVGSSFDTAALSLPLDVIPLVPQASADLAVALAVRSLGGDPPSAGVRLIPPEYIDRGSVVRAPSPERSIAG